jgi:Outer membrane protein beta-barrel family
MGFKIKKINTRLFFGPGLSYSKSTDVFNGVLNNSKNLSAGFNFDASKEKEKKYEFNISDNISYNYNKTSQSNTSSNFIVNTLSASAKIYVKKTWSIKTDFEMYSQQKTAQLNALSTHLWNGRLEKTFKKDEFTAYFLVRDILNQNVGFERDFDRNTFTETRNDRLKRYWMVGFIWNFKNSGAKVK